jgi:hypothetical protein
MKKKESKKTNALPVEKVVVVLLETAEAVDTGVESRSSELRACR